MKIALTALLTRGLLLRCPICGKGALFRRPFVMYERCPHCDFRYDRGEEGYFSSSMAINLIISEFIVTAMTIPVAVASSAAGEDMIAALLHMLIWFVPTAILLPFIFFHHSRSLWIAMDHFFHPVTRDALEKHTRLF